MLVDDAWLQLQGERLYFQHDGAALHHPIIEGEWVNEKFSDRWIGRRGLFDRPVRSPD